MAIVTDSYPTLDDTPEEVGEPPFSTIHELRAHWRARRHIAAMARLEVDQADERWDTAGRPWLAVLRRRHEAAVVAQDHAEMACQELVAALHKIPPCQGVLWPAEAERLEAAADVALLRERQEEGNPDHDDTKERAEWAALTGVW